MRYSKLNWPKQIVPVGWWSLWSSYLSLIIAPYISQHKLGSVVSNSYQSWVWKIDATQIFVSNCKSTFRLIKQHTMTRTKKFEK